MTKLTVAFRNFANAPENEGECKIQATKYYIWKNLCSPHSGTVFQRSGNEVEAQHPQPGKDFSSLQFSCRFTTGKLKLFPMKVTRCDP
jgi:hypothetical protein